MARIDPPEESRKRARIRSLEEYETLYRQSIEDPELFWSQRAEEELEWFRKWERAVDGGFERVGQGPYAQYFVGGQINISHNCLDRHVKNGRGEKVAIYWEGEQEGVQRQLTYRELYEAVSRMAAGLLRLGVGRGEAVTLFMPMTPELVIAMLACARIGAIHSIVFSAFSAKALHDRILDCHSRFVITADLGYHNGKEVQLRQTVDEAIRDCPCVERVITYRRRGENAEWNSLFVEPGVEAVPMESEEPLFILYTSGSTGKPKAILHTTGGYHLYTHLTFKYIFDIRDEDIYWCTADLGWITGHSYVVYGPLSNGASVVIYEGGPFFPTPERFWQIIEKYRVTIFYTAPTAIRSFMRLGEEWVKKHDLSSLRLLGSVGEPINPEAWLWYHRVVGGGCCPVVDTWWQTETGGIMLSTLPGVHSMKPGAAGKPFFGIEPHVDAEGLFIRKPWPGMLRGLYNDQAHAMTQQVYFSQKPENYFSGDGCFVDEEGYHWLQGRMDDLLNVSGHRLSTAEIESALVAHPAVAEAAVVAVPHETKGQGIYCFVTLKADVTLREGLQEALIKHVREEISPIATPHQVQFADMLPKTRSGKIMRRLLRKIASGDLGALGDLSTLADGNVVEQLIRDREIILKRGQYHVTTPPRGDGEKPPRHMAPK